MLKDNLIILRNISGYSQEEIAEKINISRQAYAKWESGATVPDIEKCMRIAEIYGVSLDSLVKTETVDGIHALPPAPAGKNIWGSITINERGQLVHRFLIPHIPSTRYLHHCRVVVSQRCHRIASFLRLALIQISSTLYTRIKKTVYL